MTLDEDFGLEGRVAVVTGASGAIGSSLARGLVGAGPELRRTRGFDRSSDLRAPPEQGGTPLYQSGQQTLLERGF